MKKKWKGFLKALSLCLLLCLCITEIVALGIVRYGNRDEKRPCDVAIVLGAGSFNGHLSAVYRERINHGIWLLNNDYAEYLIFTGGYGVGSNRSDAAAAMDYAIRSGVPRERILLEEVSTVTEENLSEAKKIMEAHGFRSALVVSDPLHMKRAMLMAKDQGMEAYSSPTPTTMYRSVKTKLAFLAREEVFYIGYCLIRLFR